MDFKLDKRSILLIALIIILIIYKYYSYKKDKLIEDELIKYGEEYFNDKELKEHMLPVSLLDDLKTPKKLEVTSLSTSSPQIFMRYGNNNNHLYNDGNSVWQNMVRHLDNRIIFCGKRYALSTIEWHKSVLTWNSQEVGLELHLVHSSVETKDTIVFVVIPSPKKYHVKKVNDITNAIVYDVAKNKINEELSSLTLTSAHQALLDYETE